MSTVAKCTNCHQFNQEAYNEGDTVCARCKKAQDKGLTQLPDRPSTTGKKNGDADGSGDNAKGDEEN